eukprot:364473-Chlamydomonas_euryale.AAC.12
MERFMAVHRFQNQRLLKPRPAAPSQSVTKRYTSAAFLTVVGCSRGRRNASPKASLRRRAAVSLPTGHRGHVTMAKATVRAQLRMHRGASSPDRPARTARRLPCAAMVRAAHSSALATHRCGRGSDGSGRSSNVRRQQQLQKAGPSASAPQPNSHFHRRHRRGGGSSRTRSQTFGNASMLRGACRTLAAVFFLSALGALPSLSGRASAAAAAASVAGDRGDSWDGLETSGAAVRSGGGDGGGDGEEAAGEDVAAVTAPEGATMTWRSGATLARPPGSGFGREGCGREGEGEMRGWDGDGGEADERGAEEREEEGGGREGAGEDGSGKK